MRIASWRRGEYHQETARHGDQSVSDGGVRMGCLLVSKMVEAVMAEQQIRFNDGAAYERMMGVWSRLAGETFIDWLMPRSGLRWIDIGCGTGAFTELLVERCAPAEVQGIDPSEAQLVFARTRPAARVAEFRQGNAMALPFPDDSFDAAIMALVIFFVPDPAQGVAEMARVVGPGGIVATYAWDMLGGGLPVEPISAEMRAMGLTPLLPPNPGASRIEVLRELWAGAGIEAIETREITVSRNFADFDELWAISRMSQNLRPTIAAMSPEDAERLKAGVRARLPADGAGRITCVGRANAVKGRMPA
jgi:SAM-dependent methyltransferase